jgi:uncharacterized protein (DUF2252 family)
MQRHAAPRIAALALAALVTASLLDAITGIAAEQRASALAAQAPGPLASQVATTTACRRDV